jgi:predicted porin
MYAGTDKEGGITALDQDATTTALAWNVTTLNKADADLHHLSLGVQAMDSLHVSANFTTMDYQSNGAATAEDNEEELYAQLVYNMSKNLSTYVRFGTYEKEVDNVKTTEDDYRGRLQVQYSF